jgi:FeS assembly protein IscX
MDNSARRPLYWESTYEIVLRLMEIYPTLDLDTLGLKQLLDMVLALPEFADDPRLANDALLNEILREWFEELNQISGGNF